MSDNEIINKEIENPVKDKVSSSAGGIPKQLLRYPFGEGTIEKINDIYYYLRQITQFL